MGSIQFHGLEHTVLCVLGNNWCCRASSWEYSVADAVENKNFTNIGSDV